jgi:hypothetical protein
MFGCIVSLESDEMAILLWGVVIPSYKVGSRLGAREAAA